MEKVLYIITSLTLGGAETLVVNLSSGITNFSPIILAMENRENAFYKNITESLKIPVFYSMCKKKRIISNNYKVYKLIKNINPDVIHIHDSILAKVLIPIILLKKNSKTVYTIHTDPMIDGKGYRKILNLLAMRLFNIEFVAINNINYEATKKFYKMGQISLIQNGVDLTRYKQYENNIDTQIINIIHVGRFNHVKNHTFLIDVFANLKKQYSNCKLHLVGDGPLLAEVKKKVQVLNIETDVIYYGNVMNPEEIVSLAHIFIFPSHYEGSPLALIEALACGVPIVASNKGGIPGIVEDGVNGFLCDLDVKEFTEKTISLIENKQLYKNISVNNINKSKKFDINLTIKEYEKIYRKKLEKYNHTEKKGIIL